MVVTRGPGRRAGGAAARLGARALGRLGSPRRRCSSTRPTRPTREPWRARCAAAGFEVGPLVGIAMSITGPAQHGSSEYFGSRVAGRRRTAAGWPSRRARELPLERLRPELAGRDRGGDVRAAGGGACRDATLCRRSVPARSGAPGGVAVFDGAPGPGRLPRARPRGARAYPELGRGRCSSDGDGAEGRGGIPARALQTAGGGRRPGRALRVTLAARVPQPQCGHSIGPSGNRGSYSYYVEPGDYPRHCTSTSTRATSR